MKFRKLFVITALIFLMFTAVGAKVFYEPLFVEGEVYESFGFGYEICRFDDGEEYAKIVGYDPEIVNGDVLVIPTELDGYPVKGFAT